MRTIGTWVAGVLAWALLATPTLVQAAEPAHGVAMHGDPAYPADFTHFAYVDPDAPKGGNLVMAAIGSFDSLNPYILKGNAAVGVGLVFETLTTQSNDEAFSEYGLLAQSIEVPDDRSWVAFTLRPEARWQDGQPVTVDDVVFSFDILKAKGAPFYRAYYANVVKAVPDGERRVRFDLRRHQQPRAAADPRPDAGAAQALLGEAASSTSRRSIRRWAAAPTGSRASMPAAASCWSGSRTIGAPTFPVNKGRNNFDEIRFDYYRDPNVALEALQGRARPTCGWRRAPGSGPPAMTARRCRRA